MMDREEEFIREQESCPVPFTHLAETAGDPVLEKTDRIYGAADTLSMRNAERYRRMIFALSVLGTLLALAFLLYDEVSWYGMILACGALILAIIAVNSAAKRLRCHRKYLDYRLLAEGARVQYFLHKAGIRKNVAELLPWAWQYGVTWTKNVLERLEEDADGAASPSRNADAESPEDRTPEKSRAAEDAAAPSGQIMDLWIRGQRDYHRDAVGRTEIKRRHNDRITQTALLLAVATYVAALIFEISAGGLFSGRVLLPADQMSLIRVILKVSMGTFSAMTLFAGNYYGKLSLDDTLEDHRRMAALYEKAESEIREQGGTEELLIRLAREELSENSRWYAYQSKNKPDLSI